MPRDGKGPLDGHKSEVDNINQLTLEFAKAAAKHQDDPQDNLVVSPYNALMALSMLAKAADGQTKEELAQTLFGKSADELDDEIAKLAALNAGILEANKDQVELKTANGLWSNDALLTLKQSFATELKQIFDAEISGEDFSDPAVVDKINQWASDNTNGLIDKIMNELTRDDFIVLASALYFKGEWTNKFDKKLTEDRAFTTDGGRLFATPTMQQFFKKGDISYLDADDYEAVSLTYGEKNYEEERAPTMRMILVRPKDENITARDWMGQQADSSMPGWLEPAAYERVTGNVELPQMDIKQTHDLIPVLRDMGIQSVFNEDTADLSGMAEENDPLHVNKVTHDVVFKTDEEGSEAAAVTTIGVVRTTSIEMPPKRIDIKFDRSFVFALQDIETGTVLFVGAVNKPNNDMKPPVKLHGPAIG